MYQSAHWNIAETLATNADDRQTLRSHLNGLDALTSYSNQRFDQKQMLADFLHSLDDRSPKPQNTRTNHDGSKTSNTKGRDENIASISAEFHSSKGYQDFYDAHGDSLDGFVGIWSYTVRAADAFTKAEESLDKTKAFEYVEAIEEFVAAILGKEPQTAAELQKIAAEVIEKNSYNQDGSSRDDAPPTVEEWHQITESLQRYEFAAQLEGGGAGATYIGIKLEDGRFLALGCNADTWTADVYADTGCLEGGYNPLTSIETDAPTRNTDGTGRNHDPETIAEALYRATKDVCIAGAPAQLGRCGDPGCVCGRDDNDPNGLQYAAMKRKEHETGEDADL